MSALPASMLNLSIAEFLERAGAREPVPGGGSVAALVGALAAAMGQMTARYTVGNARYAEHEPAVRAWLDELARTREAFCRLLAEDVAAYGRYSAAARNKGDDEQAVAERSRALATATAVPMEVVAVAAVAAGRMDAMKACCNRHLLSDLVVGAVLCDAAAHAAAANARINLAAFSDAAEAERLASDLRGMLQRVRAHRDSVEAFVVG